jgi:hypothetical protein
MNMSNVILILLAIAFLWGAINLDRASQIRSLDEKNMNTQLSDSIEFLRKLNGKSPREESHGRRIEAYRETVKKTANENPISLNNIEKDFSEGTKATKSALNQILNSTNKVKVNLNDLEFQSAEMKKKAVTDSKTTVENLSQLVSSIQNIQSSSSEFTTQSAVLAQNIAEVKEHLA